MNNKDLLKQYCDTGLQISDYQIKRIPNSLKSTYIRKRQLAVAHGSILNGLEWNMCSDEYKMVDCNKCIESGMQLNDHQFAWCSNGLKTTYVNKLMLNNKRLSEYEFAWCSNDLKTTYVNKLMLGNERLFEYEFNWCGNDRYKENDIKCTIEDRDDLRPYEFHWCNEELKKKYLIYAANKRDVEKFEFDNFSDEIKERFIKNDITLEDYQFLQLSDNLKKLYLVEGGNISDTIFSNLDDYNKLLCYDKRSNPSRKAKLWSKLSDKMKLRYITEFTYANSLLAQYEYDNIPDEGLLFYLTRRLKQGWKLQPNEVMDLERLKNKYE